jgi:hypothetical protein
VAYFTASSKALNKPSDEKYLNLQTRLNPALFDALENQSNDGLNPTGPLF